MEPLYKMFENWPIDQLGFQGLIMIVAILGIVIFKLLIPKPKKRG